jgi:hypothetical protein
MTIRIRRRKFLATLGGGGCLAGRSARAAGRRDTADWCAAASVRGRPRISGLPPRGTAEDRMGGRLQYSDGHALGRRWRRVNARFRYGTGRASAQNSATSCPTELRRQLATCSTAAGIDPGAASARDKLFSGPLALPEGLPRLFELVGLARVECSFITIRMDYANFADYWRPMCGGQGPVGTYLVSLAPNLRAKIEEAVERSYLSGAPDGPRSLAAAAWVVRGEVK